MAQPFRCCVIFGWCHASYSIKTQRITKNLKHNTGKQWRCCVIFGWCRARYPSDRGLFIAFTALIRATGVLSITIPSPSSSDSSLESSSSSSSKALCLDQMRGWINYLPSRAAQSPPHCCHHHNHSSSWSSPSSSRLSWSWSSSSS